MASSTPSPSSSSPLPPAMTNSEYRNWAELPSELTSSILLRLGAIEILKNAQRVCRSWRRVCIDPSMWRKIDMRIPRNLDGLDNIDLMLRHAVDLSQGGLLEINIDFDTTPNLLSYIADRSRNLRRLGFVDYDSIMSSEVSEAVMKLALLEELEISFVSIQEQDLKVIGQSCPNLRTLKLNSMGNLEYCCDKVALAIAETMPGLRHLRLFKNGLSDTGLNAILEGCPHLKHLELHKCSNINLVGDMGK